MKQLSPTEQTAALRWFSDQTDKLQLECFEHQISHIRAKQAENKNATGRTGPVTPELAREALVHAAAALRARDDALRLKKRLTSNEARAIHERRLERFRSGSVGKKTKSSSKRDQVRLRFFHLVQELRKKENFGWRNCAAYLAEFHNFKISHAHLRKIIEEIEEALQHASS